MAALGVRLTEPFYFAGGVAPDAGSGRRVFDDVIHHRYT